MKKGHSTLFTEMLWVDGRYEVDLCKGQALNFATTLALQPQLKLYYYYRYYYLGLSLFVIWLQKIAAKFGSNAQ